MIAHALMLVLSISIAPFTNAVAAAPANEPNGFRSMESRHLMQGVFVTESDARSVAAAIKGGESFATAAGRFGLSPEDVEVGQMTGNEFADLTSSALARKVFSSPLRLVVGPFQTDLGWHVVEAISGPVSPDTPRINRVSHPATDWWFVNLSSGSNAHVSFADKSSIQQASGKVRMWTFSVYKSAGLKGRQSSKAHSEYDCMQRTAALLSIVDYRKDGSVIEQQTFLPDPTSVPPDTILSDELGFVCGEAVPSAFQLTKWQVGNGLRATPETIARELFHSK